MYCQLVVDGLVLASILSFVPLLLSSLLGFVVAFLQAITQIQEQTITFTVKITTVAVALFFMAPWISQKVVGLMVESIEQIAITNVN